MAETRVCGKCGLKLSAYAPPGLCPNCMLQQGFDPLIVAGSLSEDGLQVVSGALLGNSLGAGKAQYFGDYELLKEIARGGMGVVYEARQVRLKRVVALKMILPGQRASPDFVQRFHTEAEAAAKLDHPNIVSIYEIGEHDGQQYFSMKLVDGRSLAQEIAGQPMPAPSRINWAAQLLAKVARAVHYAHQRGILHRDLKPGNILLDRQDEPHVTDFGLAKIIEQDSELTQNEAVMGSPVYMSPEQAAGDNRQLTTMTDVYSLGVVLYELLTGRPPFQGATALQTMHRVIHQIPEPPSLRQPNLDTDIETICLKCLEKNPQSRYGSAEALADDLERWVRHESILARPSGGWESMQKWVWRNPVVAGLSAATVLLLIAISIGSLLAISRIAKASQKADENLYAAEMHEAEAALEKGDLGQARKLIEAHRPRPGKSDLRRFEWRLLWRRSRGAEAETFRGHTNLVNSIFFSPNGDLLASRSFDNTLKVWDLRAHQERFTIKDVTALGGFSADGKMLGFNVTDGSAKLCDTRTGLALKSIAGTGYVVALLDDGQTLVTTSTNFLAKEWDVATGKEKLALAGAGGLSPLGPEFGLAVSISPDGKLLAAIYTNYDGITLWDVPAQKVRARLPLPERLTLVRFSRDGKTLAVGNFRGAVDLWDMTTLDAKPQKPPFRIAAHTATVFAAAFSPAGNMLATTSDDQTVKLWDLPSGAELETFRGHESGVWAVTFSADGKRLASGGLDETVKLWDVGPQRTSEALTNLGSSLVWSPDSTMLAGGCNDKTVKIWDAATLKTHQILSNVFAAPAFNQDGKTLLTLRKDGTVVFWEVATRNPQREIPTSVPFKDWYGLAVSPDGRIIAGGYTDATIRLCEISSGKTDLLTGHTRRVGAVIFSPDSATLISGGHDGVIKLWNVQRRQCTASFTAHTLRVVSLAISHDGKMLASGSADHTIRLWDLQSRTLLATLTGHKRPVWTLAFAPDGETLASGSGDRTVRLWNVPRRCEVATLNLYPGSERLADELTFVGFSPDGNNLATISGGGTLKLLRASPFSESDARPALAAPNGAHTTR
jgi:WD40 repeat protein/predicted Ser/Thr protein kinase